MTNAFFFIKIISGSINARAKCHVNFCLLSIERHHRNTRMTKKEENKKKILFASIYLLLLSMYNIDKSIIISMDMFWFSNSHRASSLASLMLSSCFVKSNRTFRVLMLLLAQTS